MNILAVKHRSALHEYYRVETRDGVRRWLAVPLGTPAKLVTTPLPRARLRIA